MDLMWRSGRKWTKHEELVVLKAFEAGKNIYQIAHKHKRSLVSMREKMIDISCELLERGNCIFDISVVTATPLEDILNAYQTRKYGMMKKFIKQLLFKSHDDFFITI